MNDFGSSHQHREGLLSRVPYGSRTPTVLFWNDPDVLPVGSKALSATTAGGPDAKTKIVNVRCLMCNSSVRNYI